MFEQSLNMITRQVDDIHHLVNEFSSFARMPSPNLKLINISKVVTDYIKPLIASFENITIDIDNIIDDALIMADEKQIRQACSNLIKNAYENITLNKIMDGKILGTPSSLDFLPFFLYFCSSQSLLLNLSVRSIDFSKTCGCLSINFSLIS